MSEDNADFSIGMMLLELIVIIGVVALVMLYARDLSTSERIERINVANDLKLMIDTLVATPGDVVIKYPHELNNYNVVMGANKGAGFLEVIGESSRTKENFVVDKDIVISGVHEKKPQLCLRKEKRTITIGC